MQTGSIYCANQQTFILITEGPSFISVMHLPQHRDHRPQIYDVHIEGGDFMLCLMFVDSTVFKQQFYCLKTLYTTSLVMQLLISYQVNSQQENYRYQAIRRIQAISQRQFLLEEEFCRIIYSRYVSHMANSYNLKRNVDCNFCSKLQKIFPVPKIILKADWLGVAIVQMRYLHKNQRLKFT